MPIECKCKLIAFQQQHWSIIGHTLKWIKVVAIRLFIQIEKKCLYCLIILSSGGWNFKSHWKSFIDSITRIKWPEKSERKIKINVWIVQYSIVEGVFPRAPQCRWLPPRKREVQSKCKIKGEYSFNLLQKIEFHCLALKANFIMKKNQFHHCR